MNTGIMGGTFNPIHFAHLRIAEEAREKYGLDRIIFIPTADPPHKTLAGNVAFRDRYEMVRLAINDNPYFQISDIEGTRSGKSYSVDTIGVLRSTNPGDVLYMIIGSDSFLQFALWHRYDEIMRSCNLIVAERPGKEVRQPMKALPVVMHGEFRYNQQQNQLVHQSGVSISFMADCPLDISSSAIREKAEKGISIRYLVPPSVEAYIKEQRIYT